MQIRLDQVTLIENLLRAERMRISEDIRETERYLERPQISQQAPTNNVSHKQIKEPQDNSKLFWVLNLIILFLKILAFT